VKTRQEAIVIALVATAHSMSHFYQLVLAPLFPLVKDEFGVSYAALGLLLTVFFAFSAVPQPFAGFIVDRYGGRNVLIGGVALQVSGIFLIGVSDSYAILAIGAALAGLGNSVFHPADFAILNARVTESRLGYAFSAHGIAGYLGFAAAPLFGGALGGLFGWRTAMLAAAAAGFAVLVLLIVNARRLHGGAAVHHEARPRSMRMGVLFTLPVLLCFLYFAIYAAGLAGLQGFSVSAMTLQFDVAAAIGALTLTAYMVGSAAGMLAGGFISVRTQRHDRVAATGLAGSAACMFLVASGVVPVAALPAAFAFAGFSVGATAPSRDLIVRSSTPPGATGRVYGFVYSGLDVGALAVPVFYGWLMDHHLPHAVFYAVAALTAGAVLTVLTLPGRREQPAPG
jgi:MFS family permease